MPEMDWALRRGQESMKVSSQWAAELLDQLLIQTKNRAVIESDQKSTCICTLMALLMVEVLSEILERELKILTVSLMAL